MANDSDRVTVSHRMTVAAIAFAAAFGLHGIDHLRRGMAASPMSIMIGGLIQGLFAVVAVLLVLRQRPRASQAAIVVGFGSAVLFVYAHLLPTFLASYQDSFIWTTDQRHVVLVADGRGRDRHRAAIRLRRFAVPAEPAGCRSARPEPSRKAIPQYRHASCTETACSTS